MTRLAGRAVLVTGANRGMGREYVRQLLGLRPAPEFDDWLCKMGVTDDRGRLRPANDVPALLAALDHAGPDPSR